MNDCEDCTVYVYTTSPTILENCVDVRLAPCNLVGPGLEKVLSFLYENEWGDEKCSYWEREKVFRIAGMWWCL